MRSLVCGDNEALAERVRQILLRNAIDCPSTQVVPLSQAEKHAARVRPHVTVLLMSRDAESPLALLREIHSISEGHVIAIGPADDPKLILRTLRDGANEYLDAAEVETELETSLMRLRSAKFEQGEFGRLIAVLAPSGGSGSSTLAVNVATVLSQKHQKVALLDLKLEAGDLATLLDLKPEHTIADLCRNVVRMDRIMFEKLLVPHSSGVHLLAAPGSFGDIAHVTPRGVRQAVTMARTIFPYVVVDLAHAFREEQIEVIAQADVILLLFRLDFISLRNTRRALDQLEEMGIASSRIHLVVNRYRQPKELSAAKAEEALCMKVRHYIPDDPKTVNSATNSGVPVVLAAPSAPVSRSMNDIATSVNGLHGVS